MQDVPAEVPAAKPPLGKVAPRVLRPLAALLAGGLLTAASELGYITGALAEALQAVVRSVL